MRPVDCPEPGRSRVAGTRHSSGRTSAGSCPRKIVHPNPEFLETWDDFPWSGAQREEPYRNLCRVSVNRVTIQFGRIREFRFTQCVAR